MTDDPLGIIMVCSEHCSTPFDFRAHMEARCEGVPTAYIPVESVPAETIEALRAEHLEVNTDLGTSYDEAQEAGAEADRS